MEVDIFMASVINKGLKLEIFPDEEIIVLINQNIGNARFVWNNILELYKHIFKLFNSHGYPLYPNIRNLNAMLNMLK